MVDEAMERRTMLAAAVAAITLSGAAAAPATAGIDTTSALRKAGWGDNVTVTFAGGTFEYRSDGLPNHRLPAEYAVPDEGVSIPNVTNSHIGQTADVVHAQSYDY